MQFNLLNWYGKRKNCPMGRVVSHRDLPAMGRNDRLAQRQPQPHAATAVGNPVRGAVEHVKNAGFCRVRNARAVVSNRQCGEPPLPLPANLNVRARRRVLDRIVHDIDDDLHDQMRVHLRQQVLVAALDMPDGAPRFCG